jgi:hypothetical protein
MVRLIDTDTGEDIGLIETDQLEFLVDHLEEEDSTDTDYYLTSDTLDFLEEEGAGEALIALLRSALGDREDMTIQWEEIG